MEKPLTDGHRSICIYPEQHITFETTYNPDYITVTITALSSEDMSFDWPKVAAPAYYIPFGEGSLVPADNQVWQEHLASDTYEMLTFSMPIFATALGDKAILYIAENPERNTITFSDQGPLSFTVHNEFSSINDDKSVSYRIYLTDNNPVSIAKLYKNYLIEKNRFTTLQEKEKKLPEIKKLYGAPHVYLWQEFSICPEDINWQQFRKKLTSGDITPFMENLCQLLPQSETAQEIPTLLKDITAQDYVAQYQKNTLCRFLSEIIQTQDFDSSHKTEPERIQHNRVYIAEHLQGVCNPPETWLNYHTTDIFQDMKKSRIQQAWFGLVNWEQAFFKPEMTEQAVTQGYLLGAYDSYHSIHEPGKEEWITAAFPETELYEDATVTNKNGSKAAGFQNVGRKLNPVYAEPAVENRMNWLMSQNLPFNTWFVDCDAAGEVYDDYTPGHETTKSEDIAARQKRLDYMADTWHLVTGSEEGCDYAAENIAFAHGLELPSFSWADKDMKDPNSPYYIGKYFNQGGGVVPRYGEPVPIKDTWYTIFVDPAFSVPLYKLVYNDAVISTYHWDWGTFKMKDVEHVRMLKEFLYNILPLFHLDGDIWAEQKEAIVNHVLPWSTFARQAIQREMTDFTCLSEDRLVQQTTYGTDITVTANFTHKEYTGNGITVPADSVLIQTPEGNSVYSPKQ